ncbi:MFS transporter [Trebonia kvetii]|uniref:MFS transporter n=1 Tax=Trebonia kvetii TaxID=2480626 RepID=A0A6P2BRY0_9ACTN|nr:MFS transporter [Trebonia kvetii]TVZ01700.1 MFS transporter [Trebonia kvetii]
MTMSDADAQAGQDAEPERRRLILRRSFQSLESPAYRAWFFSQVFSASGTMTQVVAMSWFLLRLTGDSVDLGLMATFTFLPVLLLSPHAGALVDRVDRRKLLIATQIAFGLLAAAAAAIIAAGVAEAWMIFLITLLNGFVFAPDSTARQVYVVDLVGTERLASAVGLYEIILNVSRVAGPALGGALLATAGVAACCAVNAASYLIPLYVLLRYKPAHVTAATLRTAGAQRQPSVSLRDGIGYAWRHGPIRVCVGLAAASGLLFNMGVSLPVLATHAFHLGGGGYGLLMSVFGIGALPGALLASSGDGRPTGRRVGVLALATAAAIGCTALAPALWLAIIGLLAVGLLSIWFIAAANTLVQLAAGDGMRGRMMGLWTMALPGAQVGTGPFAGWVTEVAGPRVGFALPAMALSAIAGAGWQALTASPAVVADVSAESAVG